MIDLINTWGISWWKYFFPLVIQNTIFLVVVFWAIIYLKKVSAQIRYSIALLGVIKLLIPAFLPISWISLSNIVENSPGASAMINSVMGLGSSDPVSMQNVTIYGMLLMAWIIIGSILIGLPILSYWRINYRLRRSVLIETIRDHSGARIQVFETDVIAVPMTIGIRSKKIFVPRMWEKWSEDYRNMAITHELFHIRRHDGFIGVVQTVVQALYFFHPLVWVLNRRLNELREMVCDELAVGSRANDSVTYCRFLTDVAENLVLIKTEYPTMSSLGKKKTELFNRIQYLLEDTMKTSKGFTRFLTPTLVLGIFLLSWNCQGITQTTRQSDVLNDKSKPTDRAVKFIPYDSPPAPLSPIIPHYPKVAQAAGIEGLVIVQAFIDDQGIVKKTTILKGIPNTGLNEAAMEALKAVRFTPAMQKDKPVGVWISVPVNFKLNNKTE
ncbi:MAG: M56 family metallopeptidase [FCB group bacterium]|nr:M56 family metallopeptidase [FCB group bacterium]